MFIRTTLLVLFTLLQAACSEPPYSNIDNAQLKSLLAQGIPIYDIRRADEWISTGVVAGSRKLTFVDVSGRLNPEFVNTFTTEVGRDQPVILICRTGNRTQALARELAGKRGYSQVYNVTDGITRWISEGNGVIRP